MSRSRWNELPRHDRAAGLELLKEHERHMRLRVSIEDRGGAFGVSPAVDASNYWQFQIEKLKGASS